MKAYTAEGNWISQEAREGYNQFRAKFGQARKAGRIRDMRGSPCNDCGRTSVHHDHRNYTRWWETDPVCRRCNYRRGRGEPFKHIPCNYGEGYIKLVADHLECINQFSESLFRLNDEELAL